MRDKQPINANGECHGYWEIYWDEEVYSHGNYVNDEQYGYWFVKNNSYENKSYFAK